MPGITDAKILILATNGFERSELVTPRDSLRDAGATVHVASPGGEAIKSWDEKDWSDTHPVDADLENVKVDDYDAVVLPGGQINPDILRTNATAVKLVKDFTTSGKVVAAICHGPWMLVEADVVRDREVTSYPSIRTDLKNAGANVVDKEVACDKGIVTSRNPGDLTAFVNKIIEEVEEGLHRRNAA
ncbi:type 1 glutamine amidotransferase domain-containing protein [Pelagovum pacificum]|uniref:Type 1 glutamine amidotransferase n=1 Tax=Pelagovum pacificum TaxID=2588711 RepID=A0A5C5G7V9_9RHOB|nr:type 1 glutamine amidotransferase domain-containing protein [Pelagovum pacificum]QQA41792.1 type 1 glutamine amidotransferase [Pelagovum pacificum]TNY30766.1 type 1 glutamine amidotransferase [Pelagovum pacificum]